jgi:hypothetical protein
MDFLFGLIIIVGGAILKRYALPAIIGTIILSAVVGGICTFSGGQFWQAAKYTVEVCAGLGALALVATIFSAISGGFR